MRFVATTVLVALLNVGCTGTHGGGGLSVGKATGAFGSQNEQVVIVLLADGCSGSSAAAFPGRNSGELHAKDGREIPWSCRTRDGQSGRATIDGVDFDLAKGCVFLVSTKDKKTTVRQLHRDISGLTHMSPMNLEQDFDEWAKADPEIREFVQADEAR